MFILSIIVNMKVLASTIKQENEIKYIKIREKLSIFSGYTIPYVVNSKESTKKNLKINKWVKAIRQKIDLQKLIVFLYLSNKYMKTEIKTKIPFKVFKIWKVYVS